MPIPAKPGAVRRNSSTSSSHRNPNNRPQKRNSFQDQDLLGGALSVGSPPSSTTSRTTLTKRTSIPKAPSLAVAASSNDGKPAKAATSATSVSTIGRRKLGKADGRSEYQREQQAKKDNTIVNNMLRILSEKCLDVSDEGRRKVRIEQQRKFLKRQVYGHLPTLVFKAYWHEACERLEEEVRIRRHEMEEDQKKKASKRKRPSDGSMTIPRKRPSIGSQGDMTIPRKRPSIGSQGDMTIPRKRPSMSSQGDMTIPRKRPSIGSQGGTTVPRIPRKRPSLEEIPEVIDLVDTDDEENEQEWSGEDHDVEMEQGTPPKETHRKEAPAPVVVVDPFEGAGSNRWTNLILGSKYQGERFAIGEWDSIQPVKRFAIE
ncbi:MAG: hypothetical protein SGBAC_003200 [Bacillariaceae sp.]